MDIGATLQSLFSSLLVPFRRAMEAVGLHPVDMQVWALIVVLFMLAIGIPGSYGDWVLTRRRVQAKGTITRIDRGDTDTPRIAFTDQRGETVEFSSSLPIRFGADGIGDTVAVVYDPLNPRRAREAGRHLTKAFAFVVWYGLAIAIFVYALVGTG